ncbi:hypothetical protein DFR48_1054 [Ciceribacter lividus]|uniref:Uncharacterized protein n=1 Tax=Ciceribacter lividus TaxID=1197950 RepID=A0A6I7HMI5_9HYPH|nr:hypothetical protein [Ciceribacter lividus]RCW24667.1 hypothetical protein DFR48_1054 [Ciceribacter lividus]
MPNHGKKDGDEAGDAGSIAADNETLGDALSKVGFVPAKVGRRTVSQGKRRENLKRWNAKDPDK